MSASRTRARQETTGAGKTRQPSVSSTLVGRGAELDAMRQVVTRAVEFQAPQLLLLVGNQGTGKTRLVEELLHRHVAPPVRVYRGRASADGPRHGVIASLLRDRFGIREHDAAGMAAPTASSMERPIEQIAAEVRAVLGNDERIDEILYFLGSLLALGGAESAFLRLLSEDRGQHDAIARAVLGCFLEHDAQRSPLVLVLDDVQWADEASLRLLQELGAGLSGAPVVLIVCARPEILVRCPALGSMPSDHERIELGNLAPAQAMTMLRNLLARCEHVPHEVIEDAAEMTGGNPQFMEQLVHLLLTNGSIDVRGPVWRLDPARAAETELPISVEEAIAARIAALSGEERDLLEKGATMGNVFWLSAVVSLTRMDAAAQAGSSAGGVPGSTSDLEGQAWTRDDEPVRKRMQALVAELVERDYLLQLDAEDSTIPGELELVFKHNLERELILEGTEPGRLARYHRLAAQWMEAKLAGRSEEQLEFLGQLYERGGDRARAAHCYLAGGDKARHRYANQEAMEFYRRGLVALDQDDALARLAALHNLGDVLDRAGNTEEAQARFGEMLRLAWLLDNPAKAGAAHGRLGRIHRRLGEYDEAMQHLRQSSDLFARAGDVRGIAATLDDMGKVFWLCGTYDQALLHYRRALDMRRNLGDRRSIALSLANIGRVYRDSGRFQEAVAHLRESLDLRREIRDKSGMVQSLCDLGGVHGEDGNHAAALELLEEAHHIARDIDDKVVRAEVLSRLGECKSAMGRGEEAVMHLRAAIELATQLGNRVSLSECCRRLAEVYLRLGQQEHAQDEAKRALFISESVGSRVHTANAHRVLAETIAARRFTPGEQEQAERHFREAIEILGAVRNELELARVYRAFASFRERIGKVTEAATWRGRADAIYARLRGAAAAR